MAASASLISSTNRYAPTQVISRVTRSPSTADTAVPGRLPTWTRVPPRAVARSTFPSAAGAPDASNSSSASSGRVSPAARLRTSSAPMALATASEASLMSAATTEAAPRYLAAATTREPIGPAPLTTTSRPRTSPARCTACSATASGSASAPCSVLTPSGSAPGDRPRRHARPGGQPARHGGVGGARRPGHPRDHLGGRVPVRRGDQRRARRHARRPRREPGDHSPVPDRGGRGGAGRGGRPEHGQQQGDAAAGRCLVSAVVTGGETMALLDAPASGRLGGSLPVGIGGAESNVAIGLARLGVDWGWGSRVGADGRGTYVTREIRAEGGRVVAVRDPDAPTGLMLKEHRNGRPWWVRYYRAGSAASRLSTADVDAVADEIGAADVLHLTGITAALGASPLAAVRRAIEVAHAAGTLVSFDVNHRATLWSDEAAAPVLARLAAAADLVFAGPEEAALVLGRTPGPS